MAKASLADLTMRSFEEGKRLVAPLIGYPGVGLIGSTIKLALQNCEIHYEVLKKLVDTFHPDMILPLMQLTIEANALGIETVFPINDVPQVKEGSFDIDNLERELEKLDEIKMLHDCRIRCCLEVSRRMDEGMPEEILKGAYVIGPYSLAAMMLGAEDALMASLMRQDDLEMLCRFTTEKIEDYMIQLIAAGADMICFLEPSAMMLYPEGFERFSASYVNDMTSKCKEYDGVDTAYHICGNTMPLIQQIARLHVDAISLDSKEAGVRLPEVAEVVKAEREGLVIIGNISPTDTMLYGKPEYVKRQVNDLMDSMKSYPYFVLSTGCELPPETPVDNVLAFMEAGRGYRPQS